MPGTTTRYQLPYPLGSESVRDGDNTAQALAEKLDTTLYAGGVWTNLVLGSGWSAQATFAVPQYRIAGGICYLRGSVRRGDNSIPGTSTIFNCPMPGGGGTSVFAVLLSAVTFDASAGTPYARVLINPRSTGVANCLNAAPVATGNMVDLNGLMYPVT